METAATSWMFWSSVQLKPTWKEATSGRGEREDPHHAKPDIWTGGRASERITIVVTGTDTDCATATMVRGDAVGLSGRSSRSPHDPHNGCSAK